MWIPEKPIHNPTLMQFVILEQLKNRELAYIETHQILNNAARVASLEWVGIAETNQKISTLVSSSDKAVKTKKTLIEQGKIQVREWLSSAKDWVSGLLSVLPYEKYRLIKRTKAHTGEAGRQFIAAFVFGSVNDLEKSTKRDLKALGLLHLASASGANVSLIVSLVQWVTKRLPRGWHFSVILGTVVGYAALVEFSAPIVRAALGATYQWGGQLVLRRPVSQLGALVASAGTMLCFRPQYVNELSFQLSCLATLGLACFGTGQPQTRPNAWETPLLKLPFDLATRENVVIGGLQPQVSNQSSSVKLSTFARLLLRNFTKTLSDSLFTSLAAQVFVTPFIWLRLGEFAPSSLLANTCLLWITPLLTQLCLALVLATTWAGDWPHWFYWLCQRFLGKSLDLTAEIFLSGVTLLSRFDHWLQLHHAVWGGVIGWWLLTGWLVVKTMQQTHRKHDDTF